MRRRDFIQIVSALAAAWPLATRAQPTTRIARIGFLGSASAAGSSQSVKALREGLKALGYVEGKNIIIEFRWAEGKYERLPELVADLIRLNVDLLVTHGTPGTKAAKRVTTNIPIVMAISGDAVATGIVSNLGRPDANVTGSTFFLPELNTKRLELLKEVLPHVTHVGVLSNPANPVSTPIVSAMTAAATSLKLEVEVFKVHGPSDFVGAFEAVAKSHVHAVAVTEDGEFAASFKTIAALAAGKKLPSIGSKEYAEAGGLIGYGVNILTLYRRAAYFVDKILKGSKPADLPIEQPTRFDFLINLKTVKTLGLTVPPSLLSRADELIEWMTNVRYWPKADMTFCDAHVCFWPKADIGPRVVLSLRTGVARIVPFKVGSWPAAKTLAKIKKTAVSVLRSLPVDIVFAIEAVQRAGLTVYGVEITLAGAINISTQPTLPSASKRPTMLRQVTETDLVEETTPSKKLV